MDNWSERAQCIQWLSTAKNTFKYADILHTQSFFSYYSNLNKQVCIPVGCVPPACCPYLSACNYGGGGVSALRSVCSWGCVSALRGGYLLQRGVLLQRRYLLLGGVWTWGCIPACTEVDTLPCEQNDRQV